MCKNDWMHALFSEDVSAEDKAELEAHCAELESPFGYLTSTGVGTGNGGMTNASVDSYHIDTVWPFEQALIHIASGRHSMTTAAKVAMLSVTGCFLSWMSPSHPLVALSCQWEMMMAVCKCAPT
jgi:hypothetical protein